MQGWVWRAIVLWAIVVAMFLYGIYEMVRVVLQ